MRVVRAVWRKVRGRWKLPSDYKEGLGVVVGMMDWCRQRVEEDNVCT